jgi:FkbM family methyltransferase
MVLAKIKHEVKIKIRSEYREKYLHTKELERIKKNPRYTIFSTDLLTKRINVVDGLSFYYSYKEIFQQEIYGFITNKNSPVILDGGSNIGLSIIYFKQRYPNCKIVAFEADPQVFEVLQSNVNSFEYDDVELINKALWDSQTFLDFTVEGADGGRVSRNEDMQNNHKIQVETVCLKNYLDCQIDFLKLDIEGAEYKVLADCSDSLHNVQNIFVEYHSFADEEQQLYELIGILKKANFRIQIQTQFSAAQPFLERPLQLGMDLQLNIFGYRS